MLQRKHMCFSLVVSALVITSCTWGLPQSGVKGNDKNQTQEKGKSKDAGKKSPPEQRATDRPTDPALYVGADTCKTCHEEQAASYEKGPHWKTTLAKHNGPE